MQKGLACVTALAKLKRWSTGCLAASNALLCRLALSNWVLYGSPCLQLRRSVLSCTPHLTPHNVERDLVGAALHHLQRRRTQTANLHARGRWHAQ